MIDYIATVKEDWLFEQEMKQVIGLIFQVRNTLGAGRSEEIYHRALVKALTKAEIPTQSKPRRAWSKPSATGGYRKLTGMIREPITSS